MSIDASIVSNRSVDIVNASGAKTGTAELPAELFDVTANIPLIHQVVVAQLAAARQGTHSTKTRADVRGGGRKPHRQKGTGRARQGSTRSPQFAGGGVAHGPHPHGYAQRTPKKMIAAALRGALSDRARDGKVHVIDDLVVGDYPSTKVALAAIAAVSTSNKVLVVIQRDEDLAWLSLRNAVAVHAIAADQLNAYDVLVNDEVVFTATALAAYVAGPASGKSAKAVASSAEIVFDEPTNAELAAASVEDSAAPTNAELAASAGVASTITELDDLAEPIEVEPVDGIEPVDEVEVIDVVEPAVVEPAAVVEPTESIVVTEPTEAVVVTEPTNEAEPTEVEPTDLNEEDAR